MKRNGWRDESCGKQRLRPAKKKTIVRQNARNYVFLCSICRRVGSVGKQFAMDQQSVGRGECHLYEPHQRGILSPSTTLFYSFPYFHPVFGTGAHSEANKTTERNACTARNESTRPRKFECVNVNVLFLISIDTPRPIRVWDGPAVIPSHSRSLSFIGTTISSFALTH